jgi:hypothetical protein
MSARHKASGAPRMAPVPACRSRQAALDPPCAPRRPNLSGRGTPDIIEARLLRGVEQGTGRAGNPSSFLLKHEKRGLRGVAGARRGASSGQMVKSAA